MICSTTFYYRVSYADTDNMGYLHHSNYLRIYEIARWEMFRDRGIPYKTVEENGYMLPVIDLDVKYNLSAVYDDLLRIETVLEECIGAKIIFSYHLFNEDNILINKAKISLCFINKDSRKPVRIPAYIYNILKQ